MNLLTLLSALLLAAHTHAYKILVIFGVPSQSHNILAKGIVDSLLKAGHEVTWATTFPEKVKPDPNLDIIDISATAELNTGTGTMNHPTGIAFVKEYARNISEIVANTKALRDVLVNQQFDAVVNEWFFSDIDAGFAAIQQAPWILVSGIVMHPHLEGLVDEVRSVNTVPILTNGAEFSMPMTFWQRGTNLAIHVLTWLEEFTKQSAIASRYEQLFGPLAAARGVTLPPFNEALHNVSVLLVNSHPSISTAQVLPANVVEVAGYHVSETTAPLPKDLQDILDSSKQGVVYFSLGTVLKTALLPEHTRKALIQILKELPFTVLWKYETELSGLPNNVHVRPWFPQNSVLAHPNVKLFITHGGLLSCLEAIYYGVPILAVPVFGDQLDNAERAVKSGYAKKVPFSEHMAPELRVALKGMLADDSYYNRAKYLSKLFHNRPTPPSKLVSHYVELAIESKGAYHLRSPSQLYTWYERWMLDLLAAILLLLYVIKTILTRLFRRLCKKEAEKIPQGKTKRN